MRTEDPPPCLKVGHWDHHPLRGTLINRSLRLEAGTTREGEWVIIPTTSKPSAKKKGKQHA